MKENSQPLCKYMVTASLPTFSVGNSNNRNLDCLKAAAALLEAFQPPVVCAVAARLSLLA
jgi:hypothetical protein